MRSAPVTATANENRNSDRNYRWTDEERNRDCNSNRDCIGNYDRYSNCDPDYG